MRRPSATDSPAKHGQEPHLKPRSERKAKWLARLQIGRIRLELKSLHAQRQVSQSRSPKLVGVNEMMVGRWQKTAYMQER